MDFNDFKPDPTNAKPLHQQAEEILRRLISQEEYKSGKLLPNEVELSKQWQISRNTLRQAINKLVMEGMLERKKGYGTRVVHKAITSGVRNWLSFTQEMKMLGIEVRNYELGLSFKSPDEKTRNFFKMKDNEKCFVMERVRGSKDYPFVFFISYFNPEIPFTGDEDFSQPLYSLLESKFNIVVKTSKEEISARLAGKTLADKLEISPNDPILVRKRYVLDVDDRPIEYNIGYYRADSFTYTIEATR